MVTLYKNESKLSYNKGFVQKFFKNDNILHLVTLIVIIASLDVINTMKIILISFTD